MSNLENFLSTVPIFREVPIEQLREIVQLFKTEKYPAGTLILHQGKASRAVYFLRSGQLAVRVNRAEGRETVAYLQPGAVFGELSFITGRTCSADVEVMVDADVVYLPKEAVPHLPKQREAILRGMMTILAERLHDTVTRGARALETPVVLLQPGPSWEAPKSFAAELCRSLAEQTHRETLVANLGAPRDDVDAFPLRERAFRQDASVPVEPEEMRHSLAARLTAWKQRFPIIILNPLPGSPPFLAEAAAAFADYRGVLAGPGDPVPKESGSKRFAVQSSSRPTLGELHGSSQLLADAAEAERAYVAGRPVSARFRRTVDSIGRAIMDMQIGIALGGGAAWGWAHIGVLDVLERAGLPIDVVAGCSMGTVVGSLRCSGRSIEELREIANYWRGRTKRFIEWRVWRMHLVKEKAVRRAFLEYFGESTVNQLELPFWANAVDIGNGKEYTIKDGMLVDAVRASIALPGLLPPAERDGRLLVDAGIMDPVPVNLVRRMGCRYAIAINAMAPLEATPVNRRYPLNMFDVMFRCTRVMGHEIGQARAEAAANCMMTPPVGDITMLQFDRSEELIAIGRRVAEENLPAILAAYERLKSCETAAPAAAETLKF